MGLKGFDGDSWSWGETLRRLPLRTEYLVRYVHIERAILPASIESARDPTTCQDFLSLVIDKGFERH